MKREVIWWAAFVVVAFIAIGQMTAFKYHDIDIQMHDTYYVVPPWLGIVIILVILGLLRSVTKLVDRLGDRSRVAAILIVIVNGLLMLGLVLLVGVTMSYLISVKDMSPTDDISSYIVLSAVLISLLSLLTVIEVKTVMKLRKLKK